MMLMSAVSAVSPRRPSGASTASLISSRTQSKLQKSPSSESIQAQPVPTNDVEEVDGALVDRLLNAKQRHMLVASVPLKSSVRCTCLVDNTLWVAVSDGSIQIRYATASEGGDYSTFDLIKTVQPEDHLYVTTSAFFVNAIFAQGDKVWVGTSNGFLYAYDVYGEKMLAKTHDHHAGIKDITGVSITSDSSVIATHYLWTSSEDSLIMHHHPETGAVLHRLFGHASWVRCMTVVVHRTSAPPTFRESSSYRKRLDEEGATLIPRSGSKQRINTAAFFDPLTHNAAASEVELWSGSEDGVRVWSVQAELLGTIRAPGNANACVQSLTTLTTNDEETGATASCVWAGGSDGHITIFDVVQKQPLRRFFCFPTAVSAGRVID